MKIAYWVLTGPFCVVNIVAGLLYVNAAEVPSASLASLGYPAYLATIVGVWKIGGALALLVPGFKTTKIWAYAGFFFLYSGAFVSHVAAGQPIGEAIPAFVLLLMMMGSYLLRDNRLD